MSDATAPREGANGADDAAPAPVPFRAALRLWAWIGLVSFGGPTGQIALLHAELVAKRRWLAERRFLHALDFCMLLPGPEAQQLATYSGWLLHGTRGALAAGALFVLPSAVLLWALAWFHAAHGERPFVAAFLAAFQPAVIAIVAVALVRIGRRALRGPAHVGLAAGALGAIRAGAPFPAVIAAAGTIGFFGARIAPRLFAARTAHAGGALAREAEFALSPAALAPPSAWRAVRTACVCLALWWTPLVVVRLACGAGSVFVDLGLFFSKAALVTFGGAYAVLPYIADASVAVHGWTSTDDVMVGLALAETTPGPLIMVTQWIGFLGAWHEPSGMAPWAAATLGAALVTWVTFLPCFLFVLVGAPWVERLRGRPALAGALSAITAAVVGVIANLALWFTTHAIVRPDGGVRLAVAAAAVLFAVALVRWKWSMPRVVGAAAVLGLVNAALGGALLA